MSAKDFKTDIEIAQEAELLPIEDEKEWDMVEEVLNTFLDEEGNF